MSKTLAAQIYDFLSNYHLLPPAFLRYSDKFMTRPSYANRTCSGKKRAESRCKPAVCAKCVRNVLGRPSFSTTDKASFIVWWEWCGVCLSALSIRQSKSFKWAKLSSGISLMSVTYANRPMRKPTMGILPCITRMGRTLTPPTSILSPGTISCISSSGVPG